MHTHHAHTCAHMHTHHAHMLTLTLWDGQQGRYCQLSTRHTQKAVQVETPSVCSTRDCKQRIGSVDRTHIAKGSMTNARHRLHSIRAKFIQPSPPSPMATPANPKYIATDSESCDQGVRSNEQLEAPSHGPGRRWCQRPCNEQQRTTTSSNGHRQRHTGPTNTMTSTYMSQQGLPDRRRFPTGWTECRPPAGAPAAAA